MNDWNFEVLEEESVYIRYQLHENKLSVNFEVYSICFQYDDKTVFYFEKEEDSGVIDPTVENVENATHFLTGHIKWDGCSNIYLPYLHCCSRKDLVKLGTIFNKLYDIAAKLMPDNERYLQ
jgi:hypothetical protein